LTAPKGLNHISILWICLALLLAALYFGHTPRHHLTIKGVHPGMKASEVEKILGPGVPRESFVDYSEVSVVYTSKAIAKTVIGYQLENFGRELPKGLNLSDLERLLGPCDKSQDPLLFEQADLRVQYGGINRPLAIFCLGPWPELKPIETSSRSFMISRRGIGPLRGTHNVCDFSVSPYGAL